jgi:glycosyltransferase involved in cell wall biosynthesis
MKILMVAPQPFFQPRGTPFSVLGRLHALSELGHSVDLVTYHVGQDVPIPNVAIHRTPAIPFVGNVKIGPSLAKIPMDLALFLKTILLLRKNKYDVLHTHEEAGFMGILLKKWFKIAHIYDMHSSLPQQLHNFEFTKSKLIHGVFDFLENSTLKSAEGVITICPELYNYVEDLAVARNHVLIENVVDYASLFSQKNGHNSNFSFSDSGWAAKVKILYVGTFEPYQGIDLLIDGAQKVMDGFPNAHFIMVGGKPEQVDHYARKVGQKQLSDYFTFTGSVSPNYAERFVEFSDVLLSPRISGNNTPLKIYSYLRSGKPIVATRLITHTQVLSDSVAVLTEANAESFAGGILRILEDPDLKSRIVSNAQQLAASEYSYRIYVKKMQQLLDNINIPDN